MDGRSDINIFKWLLKPASECDWLSRQASKVETSEEEWEVNDGLLAIGLAEKLGSGNTMN